MDIPSELNRIVISETSDQQMVLLKEIDGPRKVPIIISIFEAIAIDRAINERQVIRPMTHDLAATLITELGGILKRVTITKIENNTFHAELEIEKGNETRIIDARPSDSIAIGVRLGADLYVNESVYEQAGIKQE